MAIGGAIALMVEREEESRPIMIWVSKLIKSRVFKSPLASSIFKVNLIQNILVVIFIFTRFTSMVPTFCLAYISAFGVWANVGAFLIWYYDERRLVLQTNDEMAHGI